MPDIQSFLTSQSLNFSDTHRVQRHHRFFPSGVPPPPPSTPESGYSDPSNDSDHRGDPPKTLPSNPMFPVFRPPPPPGYDPIPRFFVYRPDGIAVPMIALDELPSWIRVGEENWYHPQWVRYMVPASLYGFPRTGEYAVTLDTFNSIDPPIQPRSDNEDNVDTDSRAVTTSYRDPCRSSEMIDRELDTTSTANVAGNSPEEDIDSGSTQSQLSGGTVIHRNREAGSSGDGSGTSSSTASIFDPRLGVITESPPTSPQSAGVQIAYPLPAGLAPLSISSSVPEESREGVERERFTLGQRSQSFPAL